MSININQTSAEIRKCIEVYLKDLEQFSEECFMADPSQEGWSLSELYCHICQANSRSMLAMEKCLHAPPSGSAPFVSRLILYFGRFPRQKYKAPEQLASIVKKITKEEAKNEMIKFIHRLHEFTPRLLKNPHGGRVKHPRLGTLNAAEWLRFIEIHSKHHLKQLYALKA